MENPKFDDWTATCLLLIKQDGLTKHAAVKRVAKVLAFQRSGISSLELYVRVTLACQAISIAATAQKQ